MKAGARNTVLSRLLPGSIDIPKPNAEIELSHAMASQPQDGAVLLLKGSEEECHG